MKTVSFRKALSCAAFVGIDKDNYFNICLDANNNRDFSDDQWRKVAPNTSGEAEWYFFRDSTLFEYYDGKQVRERTFPVRIVFQTHPKNRPTFDTEGPAAPFFAHIDTSRPFTIYLGKTSYKEGTASYKGRPYTFIVSDEYYNVYPGPHSYSLQVEGNQARSDSGRQHRYHSLSDKLVKIGDGLFRIPELVADTLTLTYVQKAEY